VPGGCGLVFVLEEEEDGVLEGAVVVVVLEVLLVPPEVPEGGLLVLFGILFRQKVMSVVCVKQGE